jgi:hypothetical protein
MAEGSITQALEIGIDQIHVGLDLEDVLLLFPEFSGELRAPLEAAQAVRWLAASANMPQSAQQDSRERFVLAVGTTRMALQGGRRRYRSSLASPAGKRISARSFRSNLLVILAVLVVLALVLLAGVTIASRALPGEPLYPVKQAGERARLWIEPNPARRLELEKAFDLRRNQEVQILIERIQAGEALAPLLVQWVGPLRETMPGIWKVMDMNLQLLPGTQLVGQMDPGYVVVVDGRLQEDGTLTADRIATRRFQMKGRLDRAGSAGWAVNGIPFVVTENTVIEGQALPGSQVFLIFVEVETGELEARLIQVE